MQIPLKVQPDDGVQEWMMLELQGDLESRTQSEMSNKFIGDLHFTKQGIPVLIIGHHILYGKVQELDKPILVMRKTCANTPMEVDKECSLMDGSGEAEVAYNVRAFIKKKLLFKTRPKPIIVSSAIVS